MNRSCSNTSSSVVFITAATLSTTYGMSLQLLQLNTLAGCFVIELFMIFGNSHLPQTRVLNVNASCKQSLTDSHVYYQDLFYVENVHYGLAFSH